MDEQKPKQNISPSDLKSQIAGQQQNPDAEEEEEREDYLFFNVMPKVKTESGIKEPTMRLKEETQNEQNQKPSFFKKYKKKILIIGGIVVLGIIIYLVITSFAGKSYEEESFLVNPENSNQPPALQQQTVNFTTPVEWQKRYFKNEVCFESTVCGDDADPDRDGLNNLEEFNRNTDPNNPDSDQDGLADGDEVKIFETDPMNPHTAGDPDYSDSDFFKGGYSIINPERLMTKEENRAIGQRMNDSNIGLHEKTIATLKDVLNALYGFSSGEDGKQDETQQDEQREEQSGIEENFDQSAEAKQNRDAQRTNTMKTIAIGLIKYYEDLGSFPQTPNIKTLAEAIKPYNKIATNTDDPINQEPYIYTYQSIASGEDFNLTYYSETQNQLIRITKDDAEEYKFKEEAAIYDEQRKTDLQMIRTALLLYSNNNIAGNETYVFPTEENYKTELVPEYIGSIPKDPKTKADYEYQVSENYNTFTLKAILNDPAKGTTGYLCNQEECRNY